MAEQPSSAYTDPFYDRLDMVFSWLGRYWLMVVLGVLILSGGAVYLRHTVAVSPDARSATAFMQASQGGIDDLKAFTDNEEFTAESRAHAALDVVRELNTQGQHDEARRYAIQAVTLSKQDTPANTQAAAMMALARVHEMTDDLPAARDLYQQVVTRFRGDLTAYTMSADIAAGLLASRIAEQQEDADTASRLRLEALETLYDYAQTPPNQMDQAIISAAAQGYYNLRRAHPQIAAEFDQSRGLSETPEAEAASTDHDETPTAGPEQSEPTEQAPAADEVATGDNAEQETDLPAAPDAGEQP